MIYKLMLCHCFIVIFTLKCNSEVCFPPWVAATFCLFTFLVFSIFEEWSIPPQATRRSLSLWKNWVNRYLQKSQVGGGAAFCPIAGGTLKNFANDGTYTCMRVCVCVCVHLQVWSHNGSVAASSGWVRVYSRWAVSLCITFLMDRPSYTSLTWRTVRWPITGSKTPSWCS